MLIRSCLEVSIVKFEFSAGFGMHIPVCRNAEVSFLELFVAFLVSWIKTWSI